MPLICVCDILVSLPLCPHAMLTWINSLYTYFKIFHDARPAAPEGHTVDSEFRNLFINGSITKSLGRKHNKEKTLVRKYFWVHPWNRNRVAEIHTLINL